MVASSAESTMPPELFTILDKFKGVFQESHGVPPHRVQDHYIPLKPGSMPVNARPYRYPHIQKNEMKHIVQEMLERGIIRPSCSPFASPVLLVRKSDRSCRLCINYRGLNNLTIKNKFPIPTIDELLDELNGATEFLKLT